MPFVHPPRTGEATTAHAIKPALPKHILAGYWHNWDASPAVFIPLRDVSRDFDVINIAFATASNTGDGRIVFVPHADPQAFKADVLYLQNLGKKVLISIGGATGSTAIENSAAQDNFSDSMIGIVEEYGFDGIDVNLEGRVVLERGDTDFRSPTSASIRHAIAAIREVRDHFGSGFLLSLAPETINVQAGLSSYAGFSGSYLPVIHALRDILTYVQVQHYNSTARVARDFNTYMPGTADFHVAMAEMLLQGFRVEGNSRCIFPPLRPEQIVMGLAAWPEAVNNGYTAPLEMEKVLNYLTKGEPFGGIYQLHDSVRYGSLRGVMTWSINWDEARHRQFSNAIRSYLDALL